MKSYGDKEILSLFRSEEGKEEAFKLLVNKYQERLYFHIRKILIMHEDTNDALQETFIKIYNNLDKFREESELFTWMYKIATNQALNFLKKQQRSYTFSAISYEDALIDKLRSDEYFDGDELQLKLQKAILTLPPKQRLVFNMKYYDELKYEEMAKILNKTTGALKASYHHAVNKIKKYLDEN